MISVFVKRIVLSYVAIKTFFQVIFDFIKWLFTNKATLFFIYLTFFGLCIWGYGLYSYTDDISKNWKDISFTTPNIKDKTDAIVVLTGGSERVRNALYLLDRGFSDKLFISGVNEDVKIHEIFALHNYNEEAEKRLSNKVTLGYSANDTYQNSLEVQRWVLRNKIKSIRLITSNYHIKRATLEMEDKLPDIIIIPHAVIPLNIRIDKWWKSKTDRELLLAEYNKLVIAKIRITLEKLGIR